MITADKIFNKKWVGSQNRICQYKCNIATHVLIFLVATVLNVKETIKLISITYITPDIKYTISIHNQYNHLRYFIISPL